MSDNVNAELAWDDLHCRLTKALRELDRMAVERSDSRLMGKADGVRLALSYMSDYRVEVSA